MDELNETIEDAPKCGRFPWISDLNGEELKRLEKEHEDRKNRFKSEEDEK